MMTQSRERADGFTPIKIDDLFPKVVELPRLTCAELATGDFELEYHIEGILVVGQPCIVGGPKKSLKTSILIDLAISAAIGGHFLGRFKVTKPCRVAMMSGESGLGTIQETAKRIARVAGVDLVAIENLFWSTALPRFGRVEDMEALGRFLDRDQVEILIIDPVYLAMPSNESANLFAQGELLRSVNDVCQQRRVTLILAHHAKKNTKRPHDQPELDDLSWAGFAEWARQWILLSRRVRFDPNTDEHRLWLSVGGSAGHSSLWALNVNQGASGVRPREWQVELLPPDLAQEQTKAARSAETLANAKAKLLEVVRRHPSGETKSVLFRLAGLSGTTGGRALAELFAEGVARPGSVIKGKQPRDAVIPVDP